MMVPDTVAAFSYLLYKISDTHRPTLISNRTWVSRISFCTLWEGRGGEGRGGEGRGGEGRA